MHLSLSLSLPTDERLLPTPRLSMRRRLPTDARAAGNTA